MNIVAVVLAGGEGSRLYPLTAEHAKPALPFAAGYRIVDFVLSNLVNSQISTIYVLAQYKPASLVRHVEAAWAPRFAGAQGMIKVLLPRSNTYGGQFKGTADAVHHYLDALKAHEPELIAVSAVSVPISAASSFGIIGARVDGRVREFREKPQCPPSIPGDPAQAYASMGNYVFDAGVLESALAEARLRGETDFGRDVLPRLCGTHRVFAYDFARNVVPGLQDFEERSYWRDVGTLSALAAAQQDAMGHRPRFSLRNPRWPIRGEHDAQHLSTLIRLSTPDEAEEVEADAKLGAPWRGAGRDRHNDERVPSS